MCALLEKCFLSKISFEAKRNEIEQKLFAVEQVRGHKAQSIATNGTSQISVNSHDHGQKKARGEGVSDYFPPSLQIFSCFFDIRMVGKCSTLCGQVNRRTLVDLQLCLL